MSDRTTIKFGTDGWRGVIADDFTFSNVCKVTRAIARYLETAYSHDRPVLIGYDTRFLADQFAQTAAAVLADLGWRVQLVDRDCPTPVIAFQAQRLNSAGALMFTASHNPPIYCGIKYIPDYGGPATTQITDAIVANLTAVSETLPTGKHTDQIAIFDPKPAYLDFVYHSIDVAKIRNARLKIKYDALYSTSRGYLDLILGDCGCEIECFHTDRDVLFGGGMPEPKGEQLASLIKAVQQDHADLGLTTDGDSDRFGIVDEQGNLVSPNEVLLVLARHLVNNKGQRGAIVRTVATTHLLDQFAAQHGLALYETPVGFKYVGEKMRETTVLIGGEESGGLSILGHIPEKDGILANLLVAEAIAYEDKPLSQLVQMAIAEVHGPRYTHRIDLHFTPTAQTAALKFFTQSPLPILGDLAIQQISYKDGIKLYLEDGSWVLLRPSGTEPLIRLYIETDLPAKITQICTQVEQIIHAIVPYESARL
ncbi:MAG: phosphoglucomutase/phosphomannomutase family protein [Leptolyngbyaceae cyanobacterium CSU_1_3]|nr:phosphoglucomutase/phosphomannomutase family protein [Leptolyngbyaceae cyanobacterium CSU_1_3]